MLSKVGLARRGRGVAAAGFPSLFRESLHDHPSAWVRVRPPALLFLLLALPLLASASGPSVVVLDWQEGRFVVSGPVPLEGANAARFGVAVDACHRDLRLDLLYDPEETAVSQEGLGEFALLHTFRVELVSNGTVVRSLQVQRSGYGHPMGIVAPGEYELRLRLTQGENVSWSLRLRGWNIPDEPACFPRVLISEVEANPPGVDAGAEWVELWNQEDVQVDVSGWSLHGTHGTPSERMLPSGTVLAPGARLVVTFPQQGIDNVDEVVELRILSVVRDRTPALTDEENDARTWHRGEPWAFAAGTLGS